MSRPAWLKPWMPLALALLALAVLLSAGDGPPTDAQGKLQGTWLRETREQGVTARHLLVLEPGGLFHETVRVVDGRGVATLFTHAGTWLYDGTNLKRRYTLVNGAPPSRLNGPPFATFEIAFASRNEFDGVDHIHGNRIAYRRVAPETELQQ
ncbi:hypothetical protein LZ009_01725 [Ramlibacter sp. XY19]|uniref:hypothetical protein n=1 Tax=Ramlibacter paludis TaxID=2908000 RepID=UPI0023D9ECC4|nr:hypothetical protein [Ramlibacter paludis]MCG2591499.1 hypothetical protein [Ramlibacter paludis]